MKPKITSIFFATVLCTFGLCITFSHAANNPFDVLNKINTPLDNSPEQTVKYVQLRLNKVNIVETAGVKQSVNRPLFALSPVVKRDYLPSQKFVKKNEVFELATIFNDKLQQLLSKLSFNNNHHSSPSFIQSDHLQDNNSVNCKIDSELVTNNY